jgi:LysM repeat protein
VVDVDYTPRRRRPTAAVLTVLIGFIVVMVLVFVVGGGGGGEKDEAKSKSASKKTTASTGTTTTTRGEIKYTVKPGDSLLSIAKEFDVAPQVIIEVNQLADPDRLTAGQVLVLPPPTPVRLVVKPAKVEVGGTVELRLKGAQPSEIIVFEIRRPTGPFKGPAHYASTDGEVSTTYSLGAGDPPGEYLVIARGDQVTAAIASFRVVAATTTTTKG